MFSSSKPNFKDSLNLLGWLFITLLAFAMLYVLEYFSMRTDVDFLLMKQDKIHDRIWMANFYVHVTSCLIIILVGPFQLWPLFREKFLKLHRVLGMVYVVSVLFFGGPSGFYMGIYANGGVWASIGFLLMATFWMLSTYLAYKRAREYDISAHRRWMLRSYAASFAAVTLRIWTPLMSAYHVMEMQNILISAAWLSWVVNVLFVEVLIRIRKY